MKKINLYWITVGICFVTILLLAIEVGSMRKELERRQKVLDSLENEVILMEDALDVRKEEVDLLLQLNKDDFDRIEDIEKKERLFQE